MNISKIFLLSLSLIMSLPALGLGCGGLHCGAQGPGFTVAIQHNNKIYYGQGREFTIVDSFVELENSLPGETGWKISYDKNMLTLVGQTIEKYGTKHKQIFSFRAGNKQGETTLIFESRDKKEEITLTITDNVFVDKILREARCCP